MLHDISHDTPTQRRPDAPAGRGQLARQQAIRQIERKRRFWAGTVGTLGMIILVVIWALAEYHNAGGWPTGGFSQSSGIPTCGTTGSSIRPSCGCCSRPPTPGSSTGTSRFPKPRSSAKSSARRPALTRPRGRGARPRPATRTASRTVLIGIAVVLLAWMAIAGHHRPSQADLALPSQPGSSRSASNGACGPGTVAALGHRRVPDRRFRALRQVPRRDGSSKHSGGCRFPMPRSAPISPRRFLPGPSCRRLR